jgi:hypothetical protein
MDFYPQKNAVNKQLHFQLPVAEEFNKIWMSFLYVHCIGEFSFFLFFRLSTVFAILLLLTLNEVSFIYDG